MVNKIAVFPFAYYISMKAFQSCALNIKIFTNKKSRSSTRFELANS